MARRWIRGRIARLFAHTRATQRDLSYARRRMAERRLGLPLTDESLTRQARDQITELERLYELEPRDH
jgi:hypothetical protein